MAIPSTAPQTDFDTLINRWGVRSVMPLRYCSCTMRPRCTTHTASQYVRCRWSAHLTVVPSAAANVHVVQRDRVDRQQQRRGRARDERGGAQLAHALEGDPVERRIHPVRQRDLTIDGHGRLSSRASVSNNDRTLAAATPTRCPVREMKPSCRPVAGVAGGEELLVPVGVDDDVGQQRRVGVGQARAGVAGVQDLDGDVLHASTVTLEICGHSRGRFARRPARPSRRRR